MLAEIREPRQCNNDLAMLSSEHSSLHLALKEGDSHNYPLPTVLTNCNAGLGAEVKQMIELAQKKSETRSHTPKY